MGIRLKIFLIILAGVTVLACAAGWYVVHNPDRYIPKIAAYLHKDTGLQVRIQHLEIQVFPTLLVRVYGLEIKNPKPFPSGDFLNVPRLDATIEKLPLLHGQITIRSLLLHKPTIDFISDPDGLWNFQNPSSSKKVSTHLSTMLIPSLHIENGVLRGSNLVDPTDNPGPVVLDIGNFSAQLNQTLRKPSDGSGQPAGLAGQLAADTARFGSIHTKNLRSQLRITSSQLVFSNIETKAYRGQASGDFSLDFGGKNAMFKTDLQANGVGMAYVLAEFQKGIPSITGAMQAKLSLAGEITHASSPLTGIHGTAQVTIRKGELPKLDQNQSMIALERFRPPGTG
ncbi:MAG: AsmA family protein, partial [Rhodanobacter sp.]